MDLVPALVTDFCDGGTLHDYVYGGISGGEVRDETKEERRMMFTNQMKESFLRDVRRGIAHLVRKFFLSFHDFFIFNNQKY
jgi:hypothetical protein